MTPFYLAEFSKQNKCGHCTVRSAKNRKFCLHHLRLAREKFAAWSDARRDIGKCLACNRNSYKAGCKIELRCSFHKKINQTRCRSYMRARDAITRATGICHICPKGNAVIPGTLYCPPCKAASSSRGKAWRARKRATREI